MTDPSVGSPRRVPRPWSRLVGDLCCWLVGLLLALAIRFGLSPSWQQLRSVMLFAPFLLILQALIGEFSGVYRRRMLDTLDEFVGLAGSVLLACAVGTAFNALLEDQAVPQSVPLAGGILALLTMIGYRSMARLARDERARLDT